MTSSRNPRSFTHGQAFALPSLPKVGAVCLNWARTDLCGGRRVTCVPTAIQGSGSAARDPHQKWVLRCTREAIRVNWHPTGGFAPTAPVPVRIPLFGRVFFVTLLWSLQKDSGYE